MRRWFKKPIKRIENSSDSKTSHTDRSTSSKDYYSLSSSCQVPTLSTIYERTLGKRKHGFFVEVGAFDGESFSNTSGLSDLGWHGIYVEPVPKFAQLTRERHKSNSGVIVVNKAAGAEPSIIQINVAGSLTTASQEMVESYRNIDWAKELIKETDSIAVKQDRLDDILEENDVEPGFDILVIDTEGYEGEVLSGFNLDKWRPKLVIIELADFHPDIIHRQDEDARICANILSSGYRIVYKDSINTIFFVDDRQD